MLHAGPRPRPAAQQRAPSTSCRGPATFPSQLRARLEEGRVTAFLPLQGNRDPGTLRRLPSRTWAPWSPGAGAGHRPGSLAQQVHSGVGTEPSRRGLAFLGSQGGPREVWAPKLQRETEVQTKNIPKSSR